MPPKSSVTKKTVGIYLPVDLVTQVTATIVDPLTGKTRFGGMSTLVERLLREHLRSLKGGTTDAP